MNYERATRVGVCFMSGLIFGTVGFLIDFFIITLILSRDTPVWLWPVSVVAAAAMCFFGKVGQPT